MKHAFHSYGPFLIDQVTIPWKIKEEEKFAALIYVGDVNGLPPENAFKRRKFDDLTPIYPTEKLKLETSSNDYTMRLMDLLSPIGKGQRGMIVAPPKAGKTTILKKIANSISTNNPEVELIVLLIDERPEEVTDMKRSICSGNKKRCKTSWKN